MFSRFVFLNSNGDFDNDGIPDIYDSDDDNDGIPTSVELQNHLDPFNSADAEADLDNDGLSNLFEYQHNLSITHKDTDHDGINDGEELKYWNETKKLDLDTSLSYCRIPDVDNDSIPDGKEIKGYEVKIITGWKDDGTPISRMRFISPNELDPLTPYANKTGIYTDTDQDGIPDIAESMLSNRSKWSEFQKDYPDLWSEYSWISSYYDTVTRNQNESVAKQWLQNQFNPLIRDRTPPMITTFNLWWEVEFSLSLEPVKVYAHVHIVVRDAGSISYLHVVDEDSGEDVAIYNAGTVVEVNHKFSASIWQAGFGSVKIRVVAQDYAYNTLTAEKELKGAFEQLLDALKAIWDAIWNTLCKVAEAVMKAVNVILEWIKGLFMSIVQKIIGTIKSIVSGLVLAYGALLSAVASAVNGDNSRNGNSLINAINGFVNAIIKFHWILVGTFIAVMGAVLAIKAATFGIEHVVETALFTATKNLVISMLVGLLIPGLWESISKLVNKKETSISGIWDFILNYLGITVSYGATVINIIETTVESIKKKSFSWFFAGLTLAVSGFFLDAATSAYHLTGAWLQAADLAGALISGGGLLIMILAEIGSGKKDTTESTIETVSPLLSILQWIIAIGGFAKAILDYYGDQSTGWGG